MAGDADFGPNDWFVEEMQRRFTEDPASVSEAWRRFFSGEEPAVADQPLSPAPIPPETPEPVVPARAPAGSPAQLGDEEVIPLRGASAVIAERMEESRQLPTATSVRSFPAKLLEVNRRIINNQLNRLIEGGKVSFTHIIGWAVVRAMEDRPAMNVAFREVDGKPHLVQYPHINLGLAVDMTRPDGTRTLLVPNIKDADQMDFRSFWNAYEAVIARLRGGKAEPDDFAGTTVSLTNPGTVGTVQSVPRLMPGQGTIIGVGAIKYPPEWAGADPDTLAANGVGRIITITSTYDHRVIQGAESGQFLGRINELLLGEDGFYDEIFSSMHIPYVPARWASDQNPPPGSRPWAEKQARVFQLINNYRVRGHLIADLDPLRLKGPAIHPELDIITYGVTIWDLDREFATGGLGGNERMRIGDMLGLLRDAYCRTVGIEYMHIQAPDQKQWMQAHVEGTSDEPGPDDRMRILAKLTEAEVFEAFLHTKYLGQKRFSLEGSESLIPLLDTLLNGAADAGMAAVTIGMAHRGRLNVLANIIGKSYEQIFREFEGTPAPDLAHGSGDVKYHLGAAGTHTSPEGKSVAVEVVSNPSHLEAVDPVLEGIARAKQDALASEDARDRILPLLIHGDAAFAGQGVVAETFNLSQLNGYHTGGTVHVVINNQVGFTTSAEEARSSHYATDAAKAVQSPIFHVNGDDATGVYRVAQLAFAFRQRFHKDVVIDLMCYRKYGHNEGDDPSYTQPTMYRQIEDRPSVREIYLQRRLNLGEITKEEAEAAMADFRSRLNEALAGSKQALPPPDAAPEAPAVEAGPTQVDRAVLDRIEVALRSAPEGFTVHPKLVKVLADREELYASGEVDWALAEAMAFGSLSLAGHPVRIAGEDTQRGTFSHRHAVLVDNLTEEEWVPLEELDPDQAPIYLVDSLLSEFAAMGFEYGYSVEASNALVAWEAQFGDFVNGAQVVIDQFLTAGEDKWDQQSGLVLLLPHGFEGQGPEHSSARIERFLAACAEDNMRVAVPSTPASYFHMLRRQLTDPSRKPLIVMTPKSLLRTRESFCPISDLTDAGFRPVIADATVPAEARKVILCSGKVFYDLRRQRGETSDVAVVRMEELYPFPAAEIEKALQPHPDAQVIWVQEEPVNMGAWYYVDRRMPEPIEVVARRETASPATGSASLHAAEQADLAARALA